MPATLVTPRTFPTPEEILNPAQIKRLSRDLLQLYQKAQRDAKRAATEVLLHYYWAMGQRIAKENLTKKAGYEKAIFTLLSEDLKIALSLLYRINRFYTYYSHSLPTSENVTWSHYKEVLPFKDPAIRKYYLEQVSLYKWSVLKLREAILANSHRSLPAPKSGRRLNRPTETHYVYSAAIKKVVDGDTLVVDVDLGFSVWKEQRIRLAGLDTPNKKTKQGRKAMGYVRDQMANAALVTIKTEQLDKYGRFVAHVFYAQREQEKNNVYLKGRYLNQELLDLGLAQ